MTISVRPELIPVLSKYGTSVSDVPSTPEDVQKVAAAWIEQFSTKLASGSVDDILSLLISDQPIWRDFLVLSWTFTTQTGVEGVRGFLQENIKKDYFVKFEPSDTAAKVMQVNDEVAWINAFASFETSKGRGTAVAHLVPVREHGENELRWKAQGILTDLDELKGHEPLLGPRRKQEPTLGGWEDSLEQAQQFKDDDPTVVIIGGSQNGLSVAARLKMLGISAIVLERNSRLGDSWRGRYDALCLHDPVWYDHFAYLPFPPSWPVYTPAGKLANWLESYASILELPVWLSANATKVYRHGENNGWHVDVDVQGEKKTLKPRHVVFALGWGAGEPSIPEYPGTEEFGGEFIHSAAHKTAQAHAGKKVVVIGASTSGHDVSADLAKHGVDVTMVQRSPTYVMSNECLLKTLGLYAEDGPPVDVADRISASLSTPLGLALAPYRVRANLEIDKELHEGLRKRGFLLYDGPHQTGFLGLLYLRGGGYYFDTGACQYIIDGSINIKSDSPIEGFDKDGVVFADGSKLAADVVVWATGYDEPSKGIKRLIAPKDAEGMRPVLTLQDGELGCVFQDSGVEGIYVVIGNLAAARYYSKHLSLRIKAIEEGMLKN